MLFDWLATGQVVPLNPAAAVRGTKHVVEIGRTLVLDSEERPLSTTRLSADSGHYDRCRPRGRLGETSDLSPTNHSVPDPTDGRSAVRRRSGIWRGLVPSPGLQRAEFG